MHAVVSFLRGSRGSTSLYEAMSRTMDFMEAHRDVEMGSSVPSLPSIDFVSMRMESPQERFIKMRKRYEGEGTDPLYKEAVKASGFDLFSHYSPADSEPHAPVKLDPISGKTFRVGSIELEGAAAAEVPMHVAEACMSFGQRHKSNAGSVAKLLHRLANPRRESIALSDRFDDGIGEVRRNRFFVDHASLEPYTGHTSDWQKPRKELLAGGGAAGGRAQGATGRDARRKRSKWRVEDSIVWAERPCASNSSDYYETGAALRRMFDADWELCRRSHGLAKLIAQVLTATAPRHYLLTASALPPSCLLDMLHGYASQHVPPLIASLTASSMGCSIASEWRGRHA